MIHKRIAVICGGFLALYACGESVAPTVPSAPGDVSQSFWDVALDEHAVTLALVPPYDTIKLTATPRDGLGQPLADLGEVKYRPLDSLRVQVSPDGLVKALRTGTNIRVVAELAVDNVRHADTVFINITAGTPRLPASFSIDPIPPDSAKWAMNGVGVIGSKTIAARVADEAQVPITGLAVAYTSSDPLKATVNRNTGVVSGGIQPGHLQFYASAMAYGVRVADTVDFTITMPLGWQVSFKQSPLRDGGLVFVPHESVIAPGGAIEFFNSSLTPVDVTFDDPTLVVERNPTGVRCPFGVDSGGVGNILPFGGQDVRINFPGNCKSRRFPTPGVYPFRSTLNGATGRIIVTDALTAP